MPTIPTTDEAFGDTALAPTSLQGVSPYPAAVKARISGTLPTADEAFDSDPSLTVKFDRELQAATYRVFNAFGYHLSEGFGKEPLVMPSTALSPETENYLKSIGAFNDYKNGQHDFSRAMFEGVLKSSMAGLAVAQRAGTAILSAPLGMIGQAGEEIGAPLGLVERGSLTGSEGLPGAATDAGAMMALGPFGEFTALTARANAARAANLHVDIAEARARGVIGEGEAGFYDAKPLTPEHAQARAEAAQEAGIQPPIPEQAPPDVHILARRIAPDAFTKFDALEAEKATQQQAIHDLATERENLPEAIQEKGTPEMTTARQAADDAGVAQRDLMPEISAAYQRAHDLMPEAANPAAETIQAASEGKPTEIAPKSEPLMQSSAGSGRTTTNIRPVAGTGETQTRTLSEGVEAKAIESKLTETFGDLPEYHQLSMADQAAKAAGFIAAHPDDAKAVALGQKQPPKGVLPESIFVAVEKQAILEGDVETLRQLATESKLTTAATTMGQRIRTLRERDPTSPVGAIQEVQAARQAALEQRNATATQDTVKEIRATMRRSAPTRDAWASFIETITCPE